jgi:hypothetical protein
MRRNSEYAVHLNPLKEPGAGCLKTRLAVWYFIDTFWKRLLCLYYHSGVLTLIKSVDLDISK